MQRQAEADRQERAAEAALAAIQSRTSGHLCRQDRAALLDGYERPEVAQRGSGRLIFWRYRWGW